MTAISDMQYTVRKFDETISTKCNRAELFQMRGELENSFLPRWEIENLTAKYNKLGDLFTAEQTSREADYIAYRDMRFLDLDDRLLDLCRTKLEDFIRVENSFRKFFDSDLLEDLLNSKADYSMV